MRVLGIDPSLTSTGLALVEGGRVIETQRVQTKARGHQRIEEILDAIWKMGPGRGIEGLRVGIEGTAYGAKGSSVVQIFGLWGIVTHSLWTWLGTEHYQGYYVVTPSALKKYATGNGTSSKEEVLLAVDRRYPEAEVGGNDVADALIVAAMGARHFEEPVEAKGLAKANLAGMDKVDWGVG